MPIYEYKCKECDSHFEKRQAISDAPLLECEKCGGKLEKQWSLSGFKFKGEGWYVNDYSSKKKPPESSDAGGAKNNSAGESTVASDSASKSTGETASKPKESVSAGKE